MRMILSTLLLLFVAISTIVLMPLPVFSSSEEESGEGGGSNNDEESNDSESEPEPEPEQKTNDDDNNSDGNENPEDMPEVIPDDQSNDDDNIDGTLPYCDTPEAEGKTCHDKLDYDEETRLYPCNDGTQKANPDDCPDAYQPPGGACPAVYPPSPGCDPSAPPVDPPDQPVDISIVIEIIEKNIIKKGGTDLIKTLYNADLNMKQTIVAINCDDGSGINCVVNQKEQGQCETFNVTKDPGKESLLQVIPFSSA
jgi:hypothetical protein